MNNSLVSIIIPCYNHGKYLDECLNSVRAQKYLNWEVIIVNDGSTDDFTLDYLKKVNEVKITVINKVNEGLAMARNTGIENCKGDFILPLDSDDKIGDSYLSEAVKLFESDSEIGLVFCQGEFFGTQHGRMDREYKSFKSLLLYNSILVSSLFKKSDFNTVGGYNLNMTKGLEDWDFWIRLIKLKPKVVQIPSVQFYYRRTGISMWDNLSINTNSKFEMENLVFKNNIDAYLNEWGSVIELLREYETLKKNNDNVMKIKAQMQKTMSYQIGNFILYPIKVIKKLIR